MTPFKKLCVLCLLCALCASCNMDVQPEGQISDTQALDSYKDCRNFWTGLYALMRNVTSGNHVILSDIQLDDFHAVMGNGNRLMDIYNGNIYPNTEEVTDIYASYYALIAQCNFFCRSSFCGFNRWCAADCATSEPFLHTN